MSANASKPTPSTKGTKRQQPYGQGSVRKDKSSGAFISTLRWDGVEHRRKTHSEAEAKVALDDLRFERDLRKRGMHPDQQPAPVVVEPEPELEPEKTTIAEAVDAWLSSRKGEISERTRATYAQLARTRVVPVLGDVFVDDLTRGQVKDYYRSLADGVDEGEPVKRHGPLAAATMVKIKTILSGAVEVVDDRTNAARFNPAEIVKLPKARTKPVEGVALTVEQVQLVLKAATAHSLWMEAWTRLAFVTGARPGEQAAIRWSSFDRSDPDQAYVMIDRATKHEPGSPPTLGPVKTDKDDDGKGTREVKVDAVTMECLDRHREQQLVDRENADWPTEQGDVDLTDLVFVNTVGRILDPSKLRARFATISRAAGVQLHPYTCRTTCLTQLKKLGASNDELQRQAGHASFVTTESAYLKDKNRRVEGLTREGLYGAEEVAS